MSNELEQSGLDVSAESSAATESPESGQQEQLGQEASQKAASSESEKYVPYDRFKELIEQKNEFSKRFEETEKKLKEYESRFQKSEQAAKGPSKEEQILSRLKGIDPEFAELMQSQVSKASKVEALEQRLAEYDARHNAAQAEASRSHALSTVEKARSDHKVDADLHQFYVARLSQMPSLAVKDIPGEYKKLHEQMSKYVDGIKRSSLAEYSGSKKADSNITSTAKVSKPPTQTSKPNAPKTLEEARANARSEIVAALRASRQV